MAADRLDAAASRSAEFAGTRDKGRFSCRIIKRQVRLKDIETVVASEETKLEKSNPNLRVGNAHKRRAIRGSLPAHLPREIVVEPESTIFSCCGGVLHVIGEDTSERLDNVPAKLRVIFTRLLNRETGLSKLRKDHACALWPEIADAGDYRSRQGDLLCGAYHATAQVKCGSEVAFLDASRLAAHPS